MWRVEAERLLLWSSESVPTLCHYCSIHRGAGSFCSRLSPQVPLCSARKIAELERGKRKGDREAETKGRTGQSPSRSAEGPGGAPGQPERAGEGRGPRRGRGRGRTERI